MAAMEELEIHSKVILPPRLNSLTLESLALTKVASPVLLCPLGPCPIRSYHLLEYSTP